MGFVSSLSHNQRFWLLMGITAAVLFFRLGAAPIYILDEAKNAQCAREMWAKGEWVIPSFNGQLRTDKPILHYWFMMLAYQCFGVTPFAARFFSALLGLATIWLVHRFTKRHTSETTAGLAALGLALSTHVAFEFRLSVPDPYLIAFTTAGLCCAYNYYALGAKGWLMAAAAMLGLACLAKGPVALALPGMALLLYLLATQQFRKLLDPWLLLAGAVFAAGVLPWYFAVHSATDGAWTRGFFLEHNLNRFSGAKEGHGGFFLITLLVALIGMLPFSPLLFGLLSRKVKFHPQPLLLFSGIVVALYIVFFSISSTKLPNYAMPCYPFMAICAGILLQQQTKKSVLLPQWVFGVLLPIAVAIPIVAYFAIKAEVAVRHLAWLAAPLLMLPLGLIVTFCLRNRATSTSVLVLIAVTYLSFNLYFVGIAYPRIYQHNPVAKLQTTMRQPSTALLAYKIYNPAFNFQLLNARDTIAVFNSNAALQVAAQAASLQKQKVLIVTRQEFLGELDTTRLRLITTQKDLFELPTTAVLRWQQ